ncbi:MAG TPA: response regulator [Bryobacteraceae bacterium]|nr:response regulator [Bryobacteraceae bacterium]
MAVNIDRERLILLVEDNEADEELALRALRKGGVRSRVTVVRDGEEAIQFLFGDEASPLPDLVLLDLKLPRLSGHDVLRRVRADARTEMLPVVILTSSSEHEDVRRSYKVGANSYVRKPIESEQFTAAVRQLGLYWLTINEPAF